MNYSPRCDTSEFSASENFAFEAATEANTSTMATSPESAILADLAPSASPLTGDQMTASSPGDRTVGSADELVEAETEENQPADCRRVQKSHSWSGATGSSLIAQRSPPSPSSHDRRSSSVRTRSTVKNFKRRKGVQQLITGFDNLRSKLKTYAPERHLSKIETLRMAIAYIKDLDTLLKDEAEASRRRQLALENAQKMRHLHLHRLMLEQVPTIQTHCCSCRQPVGRRLPLLSQQPSVFASRSETELPQGYGNLGTSTSWIDSLLSGPHEGMAQPSCYCLPEHHMEAACMCSYHQHQPFQDHQGLQLMFQAGARADSLAAAALPQHSSAADDWLFSQFKFSDYVSDCLSRGQGHVSRNPSRRAMSNPNLVSLGRSSSSSSLPVTTQESLIDTLLATTSGVVNGNEVSPLPSAERGFDLDHTGQTSPQTSASVGTSFADDAGMEQVGRGETLGSNLADSNLSFLSSSDLTSMETDLVYDNQAGETDSPDHETDQEYLDLLNAVEEIVSASMSCANLN